MSMTLALLLRFFCATRFIVIACLGVIVILQPDIETVGFFGGLSLAGLVAKILKKLINHERPVTQAMKQQADTQSAGPVDPIKQFDLFLKDAHLLGPGMPSSHATSLAFIAAYASITIYQSTPLTQASKDISIPVLSRYFHTMMKHSLVKMMSICVRVV
jgi:membrane-associated phospholipid phosphatase